MTEAMQKWEIERLERLLAQSGIADNFIAVFRETSDEEHYYTREGLARFIIESLYTEDANHPTWLSLTIRQNDKDFARIHRIVKLSTIVIAQLSPLL